MVGKAVTITPTAAATAVFHPEIEEVRSTRTGVVYNARHFIERRRYDRLIRLRGQILELMKRNEPRLVCAICGCPVYLVSSQNKAFFFRHKYEDGSCPAQTRTDLGNKDIRALKYHGMRESEAHQRVKSFVIRSISNDPRFSEVKTEKNWYSENVIDTYRRPDVQAIYRDVRIAFEAQLTTTFLDVVVGRRIFYKDESGLLIWILRRFNPLYRPLTEDDILFNNNSNILAVDEETVRVSERSGRFHLRCHYREPFISGGTLQERWGVRVVPFDELTLDIGNQRAYWFDFETEEQKLRTALTQRAEERRREAIARQRQAEDRMRDDVLSFWERCGGYSDEDDQYDADIEWLDLRAWLERFSISVPTNHRADPSFRTSVSSLLSAKMGHPVGYRFPKLVEVAHHLAMQFKPHLYAFGWALRTYGTEPVVMEQDLSGKWAKRKEHIRERLAAGDSDYDPTKEWADALRFLFPEISDRIGRDR